MDLDFFSPANKLLRSPIRHNPIVCLLGKTHAEAVDILRTASDPIELRVVPVKAGMASRKPAEKDVTGAQHVKDNSNSTNSSSRFDSLTSANESTAPSASKPQKADTTAPSPRRPNRSAPPPPAVAPLRPASARRGLVCLVIQGVSMND